MHSPHLNLSTPNSQELLIMFLETESIVTYYFINSLVFRRKDPCEGKHDARVENCVNNILCLIFYWGGGGGGGKMCRPFNLKPENEERSKKGQYILLPHPPKKTPKGSRTNCAQAEKRNAVLQSERLLNTASMLWAAPKECQCIISIHASVDFLEMLVIF